MIFFVSVCVPPGFAGSPPSVSPGMDSNFLALTSKPESARTGARMRPLWCEDPDNCLSLTMGGGWGEGLNATRSPSVEFVTKTGLCRLTTGECVKTPYQYVVFSFISKIKNKLKFQHLDFNSGNTICAKISE